MCVERAGKPSRGGNARVRKVRVGEVDADYAVAAGVEGAREMQAFCHSKARDENGFTGWSGEGRGGVQAAVEETCGEDEGVDGEEEEGDEEEGGVLDEVAAEGGFGRHWGCKERVEGVAGERWGPVG